MPLMAENAVVTRVYERFGCLFVEGVVETPRGNLKAAFTVPKSEVEMMNRDAFHAFAKRQLPHVTEDIRWDVVS
jgi:hypothetical protein